MAASDANPCSDEVHAALAAANLCKLRGEWQAAVDRCMFVLSLDQDSAAAHSLLGDIYRDQGHVSEAMHWYKLALDLNPDSTADKSKLDQLIVQGHAQRPARKDRNAEMLGTAKRVVAEAVLAIGVLLVITTVWPAVSRPNASLGQSQNRIEKPAQYPQRVRLSVDPPEPPSRSESVPASHQLGAPMSGSESALLQALNASPTLIQRSIHVQGVLLDPRNRSAAFTISCPTAKNEPAASQGLARSALIALREACFKDNNLDHLTVRVLQSPSEGGTADVRFVADAERSAVLSINPEAAEYSQLTGVLRNPWWASGMK